MSAERDRAHAEELRQAIVEVVQRDTWGYASIWDDDDEVGVRIDAGIDCLAVIQILNKGVSHDSE